MPPNLLLVILDTARRDAFEPYGAASGASPTVAQLAARGAAIDDVHAACSWTLPSHAAMFTGLLPRASGVEGSPGVRPQDARHALAAQADRFLPEVMRRNGYRTAAASANVWVCEASGFGTGFDDFVTADSGRQAGLHREDLRGRIAWDVEGIRAEVDDGAAELEQTLARWIESASRDQPFFWFVNLVECHSPYLPPRPYDDLGPLDRLRAAEEARKHLNLWEIWRACCGGFDIPAEAIERMRHLYTRSIRYMDDWLARTLDRLDNRGMLEETIVIVTSDHGENLGEGDLISHALSLDDRLLRVPFVVAGPGTDRLPHDRAMSLAEVPRMIAGLTGLDPHPWGDEELPPLPVAQLQPPAPPEHPRSAEVIEEWNLGDDAFRRLTTPRVCAVDGPTKLLRYGDEELLFDLRDDPLEVDGKALNGAGDAEAVRRLRAALDHPASQRVAAVTPGPAQVGEHDPEEMQAIEDRMRLLGYL